MGDLAKVLLLNSAAQQQRIDALERQVADLLGRCPASCSN